MKLFVIARVQSLSSGGVGAACGPSRGFILRRRKVNIPVAVAAVCRRCISSATSEQLIVVACSAAVCT
mgnify:CR=1 FL=1